MTIPKIHQCPNCSSLNMAQPAETPWCTGETVTEPFIAVWWDGTPVDGEFAEWLRYAISEPNEEEDE